MNTPERGRTWSFALSDLLCLLFFFGTSQAGFALPSKEIGLKALQSKERVKLRPAFERTPDFFANLRTVYVNAWNPQKMPLRVYFVPPDPALEYFSNDMFAIFRDSCDEWAKVSKNRISFTYTEDAREADIKVKFSADRRNLYDPNCAGYATVSADRDGISHADIVLFTKNKHGVPFGASAIFKGVCVHEIGHALGISGHSPNPKDIMAPVCSVSDDDDLSEVKPRMRDINTLDRVYSEPDKLYSRRREKKIASSMQNPTGAINSAYHELTPAQERYRKEALIIGYADQAVYLYGDHKKLEACQMLKKAICLARQMKQFPCAKLTHLQMQLAVYEKH